MADLRSVQHVLVLALVVLGATVVSIGLGGGAVVIVAIPVVALLVTPPSNGCTRLRGRGL